MSAHRKSYLLRAGRASALVFILAQGGAVLAQDRPIVQPGAPGEGVRELTAEEAIEIADTSYSPDDAMFMQDMIPHHFQAVQMAALVADRTNRQELLDVAGRIDRSQMDEIHFMERWLTERGLDSPDPEAAEGMHVAHEMAGMASAAQMEELAASSGIAFDRLFLELMIAHHRGAITMVDELHAQPGSAYDPLLFDFTNDVSNDQAAEIERMNAILSELSGDPRTGLSAGFMDAGEAASNLTLVVNLRKPDGFFDPQNPAGIPPILDDDDDEDADDEPDFSMRAAHLNFGNTDMAFSGDKLIIGNYHGFNVYQLDDNGLPTLYSSIVCPGGQGDVSVVGDLLIMSVEQTRGRIDCGREGVSEDISAERFRGLRIFDISDYARPVQVGQVQTCRGSHTHSVISDGREDGRIIVYNSGTSGVRDEEELAGCIGNVPGDDRTALFRIDVIEIPVADPSQSRIISSPAVFADPETGRLAGLWGGGDHGEDTQTTSITNQCHDITAFPAGGIAGGACSGNGIVFDISDPMNPTRIDEVVDPGFAYWHSATFNNDGTKVLFTDEWGGGGQPRCRAQDPMTWGANAIYDIVDVELKFRSYFKLPAPQSDEENCVAHNGSVVPVPGRDIFAQAWYQGGLSVLDFTDSSNPFEIAYFDRGPVFGELMVMGGYWSTYWYRGKIYGTEIARGLDVMALEPSEHLTANEIAAAALADQGDAFNPQQQFQVTWPDVPVVARAYVDQLVREDAFSFEQLAQINGLLDRADAALEGGNMDGGLASGLEGLAEALDASGQSRRSALAATLNGIAAKLR